MISIDGTGLSQWDKGREAIVDVEEATHVHFANQGDSMAAICDLADGRVKIPDYLLQTGKTLIAYAVIKGEGDNLVTLGKQAFPVRNRERPEDYIYDEDHRNFVYELVKDAQEATEAANQVAQDLIAAKDRGDFNGPPGEPGAPGSALIDDSTVREDAAWSSKNIIDKLCPSFEESGTLVQCEPVEGYPLSVSAKEDGEKEGVTIAVCGKNLYNPSEVGGYPLIKNHIIRHEYGTYATSNTFSATEKYIPAMHLRGKTISIRNAPAKTEGTTSTGGGIAFYDENKKYISGTNLQRVTVPSNACWMRFCINMKFDHEAQIELGEVVTDYEPYCGNSSNAAGSKGTVTGVKGINNVFAYSGDNAVEITVVGKADPVAIIEKLTSAVLSLGGNI